MEELGNKWQARYCQESEVGNSGIVQSILNSGRDENVCSCAHYFGIFSFTKNSVTSSPPFIGGIILSSTGRGRAALYCQKSLVALSAGHALRNPVLGVGGRRWIDAVR